MKKFASVFAFLCCLLFLLTSNAFAHDGEWGDANNPIEIDWVGDSQTLDLDHEDDEDWKGWATIWVWNACGQDWGDFHLQIKSCFGSDITNVDFSETIAPELYIRTAPFTWELVEDLVWDVDNEVVGATLDMGFYDNPIEAGDWAKIRVYTDNTAVPHAAWFTICAYPTLVPEPTTIALLGLGAFVLLRKRK
jgi:hypothetical protein